MIYNTVINKARKKYYRIWPFSDSRAKVKKGDKYAFISETGQQITLLIYDEAFSFVNGFACVRRNNGYGFIDLRGKEVIECNYPSFTTAQTQLKKYIKTCRNSVENNNDI